MLKQATVYTRPILSVLLIATLIYCCIWALSQGKLIYTDEVGFAYDIAHTAQGQIAQTSIPHPPLYLLFGALVTRLFGYSVATIRLVGGFSFVATLWLIPLACASLIADPPRARRAAIISIIVYALHPLIIQGSLLLDIDNTIFTPALLLLLIALARTESAPLLTRSWIVGTSLALVLWTKLMPTAPIFVACALAIYLPRRRLLLSTLAAFIMGIVIFAATFGLFVLLTHFSLDKFMPTLLRVQAPVSGGWSGLVSRTVMGGGITVVWLAIPFLFLYATAAGQRLLSIIRSHRLVTLDAALLCSLIGLILYSIGNELPMGFPRYHYPLFVLMLLSVSDYLAGWSFKARDGYVLAAIAGLLVIYWALVMPDPLLPQYALTFETSSLAQRLALGIQSQALGFLVPFAAAVVGARLIRCERRQSLVIACIACCLANWSVLTIAQTHADYATAYEYGRTGGMAASNRVHSLTAPNDDVMAPLEILFAAERSGDFILSYVCPTTCSAEKWLSRFTTRPPAAYVLTTKEDGRYTDITRDARVQALLARCYTDEETIGVYLIYFRKPSGCTP